MHGPRLEFAMNRKPAAGLLSTGALFLAFAGYQGYRAFTVGGGWAWSLFIVNVILGLAMASAAIAQLRARHVLVADEQGIGATVMGKQMSRVTWAEVAGVEKARLKSEKYLVVLALDPEAKPAGLKQDMETMRKSLNKKFGVPGLLWVAARFLPVPLDEAVARVREVAVHYLEGVGIDAGVEVSGVRAVNAD